MNNDELNSLTLQRAQAIVDEWITTIGVRYFSPLTNMAILAEETGEVARIMARKYGEQSFKDGEKADLADELADLLWVTLAIANQTGVDLTDAFKRNLDKKTRRDAERHKNNPRLANNDK
jgi:NTP pyrophosphatase (non-canonical NTP hydrolase)